MAPLLPVLTGFDRTFFTETSVVLILSFRQIKFVLVNTREVMEVCSPYKKVARVMALISWEKKFKLVFLGCHSEHGKARSTQRLPCELRFLSCMALSVYEVVLSRGVKQSNQATDKPRE